jgi:hypothetical protein
LFTKPRQHKSVVNLMTSLVSAITHSLLADRPSILPATTEDSGGSQRNGIRHPIAARPPPISPIADAELAAILLSVSASEPDDAEDHGG